MSPAMSRTVKAALIVAALLSCVLYPTVAIAFSLLLLSIVVHEAGHLIAAWVCDIEAPYFTVGFGPLLGSWKIGSTEYRLRAIPLGGFVSLPPLVGAKSEIPFNRKLLILGSGCFANLLLAFAIMSVLWQSSSPNATTVETVPAVIKAAGSEIPNPLAGALLPGDRVRRVNGAKVYWSADIITEVRGNGFQVLEIERAGSVLHLHPNFNVSQIGTLSSLGFTLHSSTVVDRVLRGSPAETAGIRPGDECLALDGAPVTAATKLSQAGVLTVRRGSKILNVELPAHPGIELVRFPLFAAPTPLEQLDQTARLMANGIKGARFSGPLGIIATLAYMAAHSLPALLWVTMLLNVSLALFNLLPLPLMDGGQALMAAIERIRGRHLHPGYVQIAFGVTMILLVIVGLIATISDIETLAQAAK